MPATKRTVPAGRAQPAQGQCIGFGRARHQDPAATAIGRAEPHRILQSQRYLFAVNVQAVVGADFKFQYFSVATAGSFHDSTAFAASGLDQYLSTVNCSTDGFWVAADDAYTASNRVLTPWPGRYLVWERGAFNYWQSSSPIFVEQTFG